VRVAALYDIHGNLPALEAVLVDPDLRGADAIVVGGDVVSGPFPDAVLDRLSSLSNTHFVRGNVARLVLERDGGHLGAWCADQLGESRLADVASWPLTLELQVDGLGEVPFCHVTPIADDPIFTPISPEAELVDLLGPVTADVVVCGHTHVQFDRRLETGPRVVNAGSIGMPYQGRRGAFWALLGPDVELRHTEYDVDAAVAAIRGVGSPTRDELIQWLLVPPDPDDVTAYWESTRGA
jgi:predicted phosphodiesterase